MRRWCPVLLAAVLLFAACGEERPEPLREFPDIPAYPGSTLKQRGPADTDEPATAALYHVPDIEWLEVQKFYVRWMPEFGWKPEPKIMGERDPHLYWSQGDIRVSINTRSYSNRDLYAVFRYQEGSAPANLEIEAEPES